MALQPCPACANEISSMAAACPRCGHPIAAREPTPSHIPPDSGRSVTIEQTSKPYKALQLLGVLIMFAGVAACTVGAGRGSAVMLLFGVWIYIVARVGAWWSNG